MLLTALALVICPPGPRDNCVVDGDSIWWQGERVRLLDIDAPELSQPKCPSERRRAIAARDRLLTLLNAGPFVLVRSGRDRDRNGRLLRIVTRNGQSIGGMMVAEGHARKWDGARRSWC